MSGEETESKAVAANPANVVVSEDKSHRRLPKLSRKSWLAVLVVVLIIGALTGYRMHLNSNTALQIGNMRISKSEYGQLINEAAKEKVSASSAKQIIINAYKDKVATAQTKVVVSDEVQHETAAHLHNVYNPKDVNEWQLVSSYSMAAQGAVLLEKNGGYQGVAYYFPFSRYIESTITPPSSKLIGDAAAIAADQKYSQQQATSYRQKLMNHSISSTDAVAQIVANPRFDYGGSSNDSGAFSFDKDGYTYLIGQEVAQSHSDILPLVKTLRPGEFSEIKTLELSFGLSPLPQYNQGPVGAAYYFIQLTASSQGRPAVQNEYNKAVKSVKVVDHV